jgi:UDP-N-acetylmuramoylalanine--D-glutamate ligase
MKQALIIGAARSGNAAARLFKQEGWDVVLTDLHAIDQKEELEKEGIEVYENGHPEFLKERKFDVVVKNPGIPYTAPFIAYWANSDVPLLTEIETASWFAKNFHYAAVTGTDGKTTITTLLHEMLKAKNPNAKAAGNIGIPLSELVLHQDGNDTDVALELSNFQLLGIDSFKPDACTISNLAPDHLDYMDSLESYYKSKFRIYKNMDKDGVFILNIDDPTILEYFKDCPAAVWTVSLKDENSDLHVKEGSVYLKDIRLFDVKDLKLVGSFNLMNAMMAAGLAYALGVTPKQIEQVIKEFKGVEHRIEFVGEINGVRIYNDSKATNTHSALAALSGFENGVRLLCGGKNKGIDYSVLSRYDDRVTKCYSFGEIKDVFADIFTRQVSVETMEQALDAALEDAKEGEVILLCPATSSFDQFKNYEVRGEIFKDLVRKRQNA